MNYASTEFFINNKSIPDIDSREYDAFFENERHKITYGVTINGVYIHGWLYWHLNHWHIYTDAIDPIDNSIKRIFVNPQARDNEWIIQDALIQAEKERKGIMLFGVRRFGKTEFEASYIGRGATILKGSQNLVTGGNWVDIDLITAPLMGGLDNLHPYFIAGRISESPRKDIILGYKDKSGKRFPWSKIAMRNYEEGTNTEAAAGVTPSTFVIDEVGKFNFAQCLAAAKPSFTSPFGWRCVPILTGTSGYIKANSDAERYFNNPEANNFIARTLKEEGDKKVSVFISGLRRMEGKVKTTFGDFIQQENGILLPQESELFTVPFYNSDFAISEALIDEERRLAALNPDGTDLLKATMYYPKNTTELFLTDTGNNFPIEAIREQIDYLLARPELQGTPCRLYRDSDTKVKISYNTPKVAFTFYPVEQKDNALKDAAIIIYEEPVPNPPYYLYIAGADPYAESDSATSDSLGSFYIYKRMYDPIGGTFQRRIVAEYTARPTTLKEWHENVELLLELYNCVCLPENATPTFIQFFDAKNKGHYIADAYDFLKEISPNTSISSSRSKGLPATPKVKAFYKELIFQYLTEKIQILTPTDGTEPITKLGVVRISSIGLLRELASFNKDGNFDRYVAFGHTLAHEVWADKIYPITQIVQPQQPKQEQAQKPIRVLSPFTLGANTGYGLGRVTGNPFGITRK